MRDYHCHRSGTLAVYHALKKLGFKAYHNYENLKGGVRDLTIYHEGLLALWGGKFAIYGRQEFDKWFQGYDVSHLLLFLKAIAFSVAGMLECYR